MPRVLLQSLSDGKTWLDNVPRPVIGANEVLIASEASVVSAGTERMLVDFGRASLLGKARSQPQRVSEVVEKARTDGLSATLSAVRNKLAQPIPLGYSLAGRVVEVGRNVRNLRPGDMVAAAAPHAELVLSPANLTVPVPDTVDPRDAAFATLGSIALQGIRLASPSVGECFAVTGLGLVGLLTVQLLLAQGVSVVGIDPAPERRELAASWGATSLDPTDDVVAATEQLTRSLGVDGVIVCASTTSSDPIHQAAAMSRKRGRIVLVGVTGLELNRADFYEKELTFQVSASYGPGRYDPTYEERGIDYPAGYVRWTAGRNMSAVVDLIARDRLDVRQLVTHEFTFDRAPDAYDTLSRDPSALGIVLRYPSTQRVVIDAPHLLNLASSGGPAARGQVGVLGAGQFATGVLLPAFVAAGATIRTVVSRGGTSAALAAKRIGAGKASTLAEDVFDDPEIDTVVIATRHDSHAQYVERALRAGKHVFVEKPLAISEAEIDALEATIIELAEERRLPTLAVGFNRRFAPISVRMKSLLDRTTGPIAMSLLMNAGAVPGDHWTQDPSAGGGRIIGEACHLIDLATYLVGAPISRTSTAYLESPTRDTAAISLEFENGSIAVVQYYSNGSKRYPKERIEVFAGGRILVNDNFRVLKAYGWPGTRTTRHLRQDKGHHAAVHHFMEAVRSGTSGQPVDEIIATSRWAVRCAAID